MGKSLVVVPGMTSRVQARSAAATSPGSRRVCSRAITAAMGREVRPGTWWIEGLWVPHRNRRGRTSEGRLRGMALSDRCHGVDDRTPESRSPDRSVALPPSRSPSYGRPPYGVGGDRRWRRFPCPSRARCMPARRVIKGTRSAPPQVSILPAQGRNAPRPDSCRPPLRRSSRV